MWCDAVRHIAAMFARHDIPYAHWQMKRDHDGRALWGEISAELEDLDQEIRQIILTPKGSVPGEPEKGCNLDQFRDRPMNIRSLLVVEEIRSALERWAPRVKVKDIQATATATQISISVTWRPTSATQSEFYVTEIPNVI